MSDDLVGRYRRVYVRLWDDPKFRALIPNEKNITLYGLTGPQSNRIGLFKFSISRAAEDLDLGIETLRKGFANVCVTFNWLFDADARVCYIPSWWRWNRPANQNVLSGNLKDISEIPSCALLDAFARNLSYLPANFHETFEEGLRQRLPKRSATSGSGAVSGNQETGNQVVALTRESAPLRAEERADRSSQSSEQEPETEGPVLEAAMRTVASVGPMASMALLTDAFGAHWKGPLPPKPKIISAINQVKQVLPS